MDLKNKIVDPCGRCCRKLAWVPFAAVRPTNRVVPLGPRTADDQLGLARLVVASEEKEMNNVKLMELARRLN